MYTIKRRRGLIYHSNTEATKQDIVSQLKIWGFDVDEKNGQIRCMNSCMKVLHCRSLYLLRHAETIGTKEKHFMSDFSSNDVLTNQGIADVARCQVCEYFLCRKFEFIT